MTPPPPTTKGMEFSKGVLYYMLYTQLKFKLLANDYNTDLSYSTYFNVLANSLFYIPFGRVAQPDLWLSV